MSQMSDFLEDALINFLFRTTKMADPTTIAIALLTDATAPDDTTTGNTTTSPGVEVTTGAYVRRNDADGTGSGNTNSADANWTATSGTDGQTDNVNLLQFPQATGNWGNIAYILITDNATTNAGNCWFYGGVDVTKAINTDDTAEFAVGAITVTLA